jgi:hypothetical protein
MEDNSSEHMQCMEVWGGCEVVARDVAMGGLDAWIYSKPFGQSQDGGDVYYASSCATGRISRLLLADVAGHGMAVAETAGQLRNLMRRFVNYLDQTEFVRSMNRQFVVLSDAGCFATALVTTFFSTTRCLSICNAGHPRPLHFNAAGNEWRFLEHAGSGDPQPHGSSRTISPRNIPLGIVDLADYEQFDVELGIGDLVLCYTDALTESRDTNGDFLGEEGLLRVVRSLPADPANFIASLLEAIEKLYPKNLSADDVTALLLRPNGRRPSVSLRDKLKAFVRIGTDALKSMSPSADRAPLPDMNLANIGGAVIPGAGRRWRGRRLQADKSAKPAPEDDPEQAANSTT